MKKVLIAYFSQGGTTRSIAGQIANGMEGDEFLVDLYNIADDQPPDITQYDMIGMGSPVYFFRPPFNVIEFIKHLPQLEGRPFFVFLLHGTYSGSAGNILRDMLSLKGGKEIGYIKFKGAEFFLGYLQKGVQFSHGHPDKNEIQSALNFGKTLAADPSGTKYIKAPMEDSPGIVYSIENLITRKFLARYVYTYLFKADKEKCNACGICLKNCPNNNIDLDKNSLPQWGRNCLLCLYCEMKCPKDAIRSVADWPVMARFMNYNVQKAMLDPSIDHVKVVHKKGKTEQIKT